jgi:hypothetical protein
LTQKSLIPADETFLLKLLKNNFIRSKKVLLGFGKEGLMVGSSSLLFTNREINDVGAR